MCRKLEHQRARTRSYSNRAKKVESLRARASQKANAKEIGRQIGPECQRFRTRAKELKIKNKRAKELDSVLELQRQRPKAKATKPQHQRGRVSRAQES